MHKNDDVKQLLLNIWKQKLELEEWVIYLVQAEQSDLKASWNCKANADNMYNEHLKVAFIRYVDFKERSLIHELLHIKFPTESETAIEKRTIQIVKNLKIK
jgi:hypothetical protein